MSEFFSGFGLIILSSVVWRLTYPIYIKIRERQNPTGVDQ